MFTILTTVFGGVFSFLSKGGTGIGGLGLGWKVILGGMGLSLVLGGAGFFYTQYQNTKLQLQLSEQMRIEDSLRGSLTIKDEQLSQARSSISSLISLNQTIQIKLDEAKVFEEKLNQEVDIRNTSLSDLSKTDEIAKTFNDIPLSPAQISLLNQSFESEMSQ